MSSSKHLTFSQLPSEIQGRLRDELKSLPGLVDRLGNVNAGLIGAMNSVNGVRVKRLKQLRPVVVNLLTDSDSLLSWMQKMILEGRLKLGNSAPSDRDLQLCERFLQSAYLLRIAFNHLYPPEVVRRSISVRKTTDG